MLAAAEPVSRSTARVRRHKRKESVDLGAGGTAEWAMTGEAAADEADAPAPRVLGSVSSGTGLPMTAAMPAFLEAASAAVGPRTAAAHTASRGSGSSRAETSLSAGPALTRSAIRASRCWISLSYRACALRWSSAWGLHELRERPDLVLQGVVPGVRCLTLLPFPRFRALRALERDRRTRGRMGGGVRGERWWQGRRAVDSQCQPAGRQTGGAARPGAPRAGGRAVHEELGGGHARSACCAQGGADQLAPASAEHAEPACDSLLLPAAGLRRPEGGEQCSRSVSCMSPTMHWECTWRPQLLQITTGPRSAS